MTKQDFSNIIITKVERLQTILGEQNLQMAMI